MELSSATELQHLDTLAEELIGKHGEQVFVASGKKEENNWYLGAQIGIGEWISLSYREPTDWNLHHQHEWLDLSDETYEESGPHFIYNRSNLGLSVEVDQDEIEEHEANGEESWEAMLGLIALDHYFKDREYEASKRARVDELGKLFGADSRFQKQQ